MHVSRLKAIKYSYKIIVFISLFFVLILLYQCTLNTIPRLFTSSGVQKSQNDTDALDYPNFNKTELEQIESARECYRLKDTDERLVFLDDVMQSRPEPDKAIFFISTSCAKNGSRVTLNSRQACSIESAAKWNPKRDIFVLFVARVGFIPDEEPSLIVSTLKSYPNIHFRNLDLYNYSMGTLGEYWIKKDLIFSTSYHLAHLSDYLRFLTLFKFGGVYMDMDIIVRKTLDGFPPNFGGEEDPNSINCAILGLESKDAGHKISELVVRENTEHYKPYEWAYSGPGALSRVLSEICHCPKNRISQARPEFCWGFKIFPQSEFYAIHWSRPNDTVSTDKWTVDYTLEKIKHSTAVHMWNSRIHGSPILKSQRTVYKILAEKNCPRIYDASDTVF